MESKRQALGCFLKSQPLEAGAVARREGKDAGGLRHRAVMQHSLGDTLPKGCETRPVRAKKTASSGLLGKPQSTEAVLFSPG